MYAHTHFVPLGQCKYEQINEEEGGMYKNIFFLIYPADIPPFSSPYPNFTTNRNSMVCIALEKNEYKKSTTMTTSRLNISTIPFCYIHLSSTYPFNCQLNAIFLRI